MEVITLTFRKRRFSFSVAYASLWLRLSLQKVRYGSTQPISVTECLR